jgi:DNA polymerase I
VTKLLLIDGNAVLHRAYHALPASLTTKSGEPINAVYGFVSMLVKIIDEQKPTHIAVCFDTPVETFRKAEYVGYQINRPRLNSDLSSQFEITYKVMEAMNIPIYKIERYEADDVIGTITEQVAVIPTEVEESLSVLIVTGDRDILQLVDDKKNVKVWMPIQGLNKAKVYTEAEVVERMGVKASQIVDYKALAGDSSDNYPGVPGVGPKTAITLLEKYDNLENIYAHLNEIPEKVGKKLAVGAESAGMSKHLATIVKDSPVTFHLEDSANWSLNSQKVLDLFAEIGFKTLTNRVKQLPLI